MKYKVTALLVSTVLSLVLIELTCLVAVKTEFTHANVPSYEPIQDISYWADINPDFGVWHSGITYRQTKSCFDVTYRSNSYGARDSERSAKGSKPRTIVIGDSFVEGIGVEETKRFTNLLEKRTGIEHLNFGCAANVGPTQYYLVYKTLASGFDHDLLIVCILPDNDFGDDNPDRWMKSGRYKPLWVGEYPQYELKYSLQSPGQSSFNSNSDGFFKLKSVLRNYTYTYNVISRIATGMVYNKKMNDIDRAKITSRYNRFSNEELMRMKFSIEKIKAELDGRPMVVVTIPRELDIAEYNRTKKRLLADEIAAWSNEIGFRYIDLLPILAVEDYQPLYLTCDGHWSEKGHAMVSHVLFNEIGYQNSVLAESTLNVTP